MGRDMLNGVEKMIRCLSHEAEDVDDIPYELRNDDLLTLAPGIRDNPPASMHRALSESRVQGKRSIKRLLSHQDLFSDRKRLLNMEGRRDSFLFRNWTGPSVILMAAAGFYYCRDRKCLDRDLFLVQASKDHRKRFSSETSKRLIDNSLADLVVQLTWVLSTQGETAACSFCDVSIRGWEANHCPWVRHKAFSPLCAHLRRKGESGIRPSASGKRKRHDSFSSFEEIKAGCTND